MASASGRNNGNASSYGPTPIDTASPFDGPPTSTDRRRPTGCCCSIWRHLFHRYDFRRAETERLYATYAYRQSRFGDFRLLCALLILLFLSLAAVDFAYAVRPMIDSVSNVGLAAATSVLLVVAHTRLMSPPRLTVAGFVVVGVALVFAAVSMLPVRHRTPWSPAEGVWRLCYATFVVYALSPLRLYVPLMYGVVVGVAHCALACVTTSGYLVWRQVIANCILMIGVNVVGVYVYIRKERAHRKLFAVVRTCSSAGLRVHDERAKLEKLLASMLTQQLVADMKRDAVCKHLPLAVCASRTNGPQNHDCVSILFADIVGLNALSVHCTAHEMVHMLNELFARFDQLATENHCLRVQLLGDCYYAVCGLPDARPDHAKCCVELGLDLIDVINFLRDSSEVNISVRVGIHSGRVECGIIGLTRWRFDIWSEDVQLAEQMVHESLPGRVHITEATLDHLHGEFDTEPSRLEERADYLRNQHGPSYFIVFEHPRKRYGPAKTNTFESDVSPPVGPLSRHSYGRHSLKSVSYLLARLVSSTVRYNADLPLANIFPQLNAVNSHNDVKSHVANGRVDTPLLSIDDDIAPQSRMDKYIASAVTGSAVDKSKLNRISGVTLAFKTRQTEYQYKNLEDSAFPASMLCCLILLALSVAVQAVILPRTLLLLLLFLISFAWISVLLMLFLGYRIKCINCDIRRSSGIRLMLTTVTLLLASSVSLINVMCCRGGRVFPLHSTADSRPAAVAPVGVMHSVIAFNRDLHLQCETPHYIYLGSMLSLLSVAIFIKLSAIAKLVFLLLICSGYIVTIEYIDRAIFVDFFNLSTFRSQIYVPPDVPGLCMLIHFLLALYLSSRSIEWIQRLRFLWTLQSAEQQQELLELETENDRLLLNILPRHVIPFFTGNKTSVQELYGQSYNKAIVCFASIVSLAECDITKNIISGGCRRQGLRLLRDVIAGFDELLEDSRFVAVDKIKTVGNVYMFCVGLRPQYAIEETEDSMYRYLVIAIHLVCAMRDRLCRLGDSYALRIGMSVGSVVAGVVGGRKPQFDIWGSCVNLARSLERTSLPNNIHVADDVYKALRGRFQIESRGPTKLKDLTSSETVNTYFIVTDDHSRQQLPPISPSGSRDRSRMTSSGALPCIIQSCSLSPTGNSRVLFNTDTPPFDALGSRGLLRSSANKDNQAMVAVGSPKVSMTPPSSLGRRRRQNYSDSGWNDAPRRTSGASSTAALSGGGSGGNLAVPTVAIGDWNDRGRSPDLPVVHYCNANILNETGVGRGSAGGGGGGGPSRLLIKGPPENSTVASNSWQKQSVFVRGGKKTGLSGLAEIDETPKIGRCPASSSEPQLTQCGRPTALARSNSQQQHPAAATGGGLPRIVETSHEVIGRDLQPAPSAAAVTADDPDIRSGDGARRNYDIESIIQELASSAEKLDGRSSLVRRSNVDQSCQTRTKFPTSAVDVRPTVSQSSALQSAAVSSPKTSTNGSDAPIGLAVQRLRNNGAFHSPATETKTTLWESPRLTDRVTKSTATKCTSGKASPSTGGRAGSNGPPAMGLSSKMSGKQTDGRKVSPPPLPPPPADENLSGRGRGGGQRPAAQNSPSVLLANFNRSGSAFRPVLKSGNSLLPTPVNALPTSAFYRPQHNPHPHPARLGYQPPMTNHSSPHSHFGLRPPADKPADQSAGRCKMTPPDVPARPSAAALASGPSFRVRRSTCVTSLPRLCRSLDNIASDVDDCGPRSGSSSRPESPDGAPAGGGNIRARAGRRGAPDGEPVLVLTLDDVSLSSFDGTGSEMSRSDPALSSYETYGGFESEYDNYRPGMASDEDYFVPDPISDIDIDMFDDIDVENVTVRDVYPAPGGALPPLHKLTSDI